MVTKKQKEEENKVLAEHYGDFRKSGIGHKMSKTILKGYAKLKGDKRVREDKLN